MAVTASGVFLPTFRDVLDASQLAVNVDSDTFDLRLVDNTITPDFDTHDLWADLSSGEVSGTGYSAGGVALSGFSMAISSGSLNFDATDAAFTSSTITARAAVIVDDTLTDDPLFCLLNFGSDISSSNGTFTVQFASGGFLQIDLTP
jgi:hypothetical protein